MLVLGINTPPRHRPLLLGSDVTVSGRRRVEKRVAWSPLATQQPASQRRCTHPMQPLQAVMLSLGYIMVVIEYIMVWVI